MTSIPFGETIRIPLERKLGTLLGACAIVAALVVGVNLVAAPGFAPVMVSLVGAALLLLMVPGVIRLSQWRPYELVLERERITVPMAGLSAVYRHHTRTFDLNMVEDVFLRQFNGADCLALQIKGEPERVQLPSQVQLGDFPLVDLYSLLQIRMQFSTSENQSVQGLAATEAMILTARPGNPPLGAIMMGNTVLEAFDESGATYSIAGQETDSGQEPADPPADSKE